MVKTYLHQLACYDLLLIKFICIILTPTVRDSTYESPILANARGLRDVDVDHTLLHTGMI